MRRFFLKAALLLLPFAVVLGPASLVLWRGGEFVSVETVVKAQARGEVLFGRAYSNPVKRYKVLGTRARDPRVLALGSSRVMQLRRQFFLDPDSFYNAGGAISEVRHFRHFLEQATASRLELVIAGLDQWFFNAQDPQASSDGFAREVSSPETAANIIQRNWRNIYGSVRRRRLDPWPVLAASPRTDRIGLTALLHDSGFRSDGSYFYGERIANPAYPEFWDPNFADTMERIRAGTRKFEWGQEVAPELLDELEQFLIAAEQRGIQVVAFLPSFAPSVVAALRGSGHHAYMEKIFPRLEPIARRHGALLFDAFDGGKLGASDDEFIDGFHGSDKTYLRLLVALSQASPALRAHLDVPALRQRLQDSKARFEVAAAD